MIDTSIANKTIIATKCPLSVNCSGEKHPSTNSTIPIKENKNPSETANASFILTIPKRQSSIVVMIITALVKHTLKSEYLVSISPHITLSANSITPIMTVKFFIIITFEEEEGALEEDKLPRGMARI